MTIKDYQLLVLRAFEALRREISEAEQYTAQTYNNIVKQEQAQQQQKADEEAQAQAQDVAKVKTKQTDKE